MKWRDQNHHHGGDYGHMGFLFLQMDGRNGRHMAHVQTNFDRNGKFAIDLTTCRSLPSSLVLYVYHGKSSSSIHRSFLHVGQIEQVPSPHSASHNGIIAGLDVLSWLARLGSHG